MKSQSLLPLLAGTSLLAACAATPPMVASAAPAAPAVAEAPVAATPAAVTSLVDAVSIPHQKFVLANGLTVLVHEDHKAPVVGVSMWYNVGSKDEPKGKTGFAHLFEHLMFNGSENLPGDYFEYLQRIGATDYNGTTSFDRTNYFQTVPTGALEKALFMESDRMGSLLGAVTQGVLDNQRGVVQNEKRQGDNQPGGLTFYEVIKALFPAGHPYGHEPIGSMADLDAASLKDVANWFRDKYGPNNAVLVLAGDVTAAQARQLVERHFGAIPRGPVNTPAMATPAPLAAPASLVMKDQVATTTVSRYWPMPGLLDPQLVALDVAGSVLGGLESSRLDKILVRDEQLAVSVSAGLYPMQRLGIFFVSADVKPGVDPLKVEQRLDQILADYVANGPSDEEVRRAATKEVAGRIRGLEQVGGFNGKAVTLAEGQVMAGDSDFYARTLAEYAKLSPDAVRTAMQQWLSKPAFSLRLEPGKRGAYEEAASVAKGAKAGSAADKAKVAAPRGPARTAPPLAPLADLDFPAISRARLSNGVEVQYAQRTAVPLTQVALAFDAGDAADEPGRRGLNSMAVSMLDEGAAGRSSQQLAEAAETLGAELQTSTSLDQASVTLSALSANLGLSLDLLADVVQRPDFAADELERVRAQRLAAIAQMKKDPNGIASRLMPALIYGADHPYGGTPGGDEAAIKAITRDDLIAYKGRWIRPDRMKIFVVSDRPLAELTPLFEARFGQWQAPADPAGTKNFGPIPPRPAKPRILLVDRPDSPQSVIMASEVTNLDPRGAIEALESANDIVAGTFLSRINMDLREAKGWSYGVRGSASLRQKSVPYSISAPVQADRTGEAIAALVAQYRDFMGAKGVSKDELDRAIANRANALPGKFETGSAVLGAMMSNALYGRPDDYYATLARRYRALTAGELDRAFRDNVDLNGLQWVVVGDAAKVRPQLAKLGYSVEMVEAR